MKNINEIIKIEDLKEFFSTIGYTWNGMYHHGFLPTTKPQKVENISDILEIKRTWVEFFLTYEENGQQKETSLYASIDVEYFCLFTVDTITKNAYPYPKNFTKEWVTYLIKTYKQDYTEILAEKMNKEVEILIKNNEEKNNLLKEQIKENNKKLRADLKDIKNFVKDVEKTIEKLNKEDLTKE